MEVAVDILLSRMTLKYRAQPKKPVYRNSCTKATYGKFRYWSGQFLSQDYVPFSMPSNII